MTSYLLWRVIYCYDVLFITTCYLLLSLAIPYSIYYRYCNRYVVLMSSTSCHFSFLHHSPCVSFITPPCPSPLLPMPLSDYASHSFFHQFNCFPLFQFSPIIILPLFPYVLSFLRQLSFFHYSPCPSSITHLCPYPLLP